MNDDTGCAYPQGERPPFASCGAPALAGSAYCAEHHLLCYLPSGSKRERAALKWIGRLADLAARRRLPTCNPVPGSGVGEVTSAGASMQG
jgi:hypothetical protein